jgi:hypothetical protein
MPRLILTLASLRPPCASWPTLPARPPDRRHAGASPLLQPLWQLRRVRPRAQRLVLIRADGSDGEPRTKVGGGGGLPAPGRLPCTPPLLRCCVMPHTASPPPSPSPTTTTHTHTHTLTLQVEFGYSRKDVILIGAGLIGLGYALYYGLQVRCARVCGMMGAGLGCVGLSFCVHRSPSKWTCWRSAGCWLASLVHIHVYGLRLAGSRPPCCRQTPRCHGRPAPAAAFRSVPPNTLRGPAALAPQYAGLDAGVAGNWVQLVIFLGICVGWVGSYLIRVATKVSAAGAAQSMGTGGRAQGGGQRAGAVHAYLQPLSAAHDSSNTATLPHPPSIQPHAHASPCSK